MNYKNSIGLHLRLQDCLLKLTEQARNFNVSSFQFFLTSRELNHKYISPSPAIQKKFVDLKNKHFSSLYIHSSYWINPATSKQISAIVSRKLLKREIEIAQQLDISTIILHPGSAMSDPNSAITEWKQQGIENVARTLNILLKDSTNIKILLENTAHGNKAIGSNLYDFVAIKKYLDYPEKIAFCLDFAHAFSYGYNLENIEEFIEIINNTMGLNNIELIHLNDSRERCCSQRDQHEIPGHGTIGKQILQALINHEHLRHIQKILELPVVSDERIKQALNDINNW